MQLCVSFLHLKIFALKVTWGYKNMQSTKTRILNKLKKFKSTLNNNVWYTLLSVFSSLKLTVLYFLSSFSITGSTTYFDEKKYCRLSLRYLYGLFHEV